MRGGTSRGPYFLAYDLPPEQAERETLLLAALGSPDPRQVDGLGGGTTLTSKAAILSRSEREDCDVDYLFAQVGVDRASVDWSPNCGNILSGVGPAAIIRGLVDATHPTTCVRVFNVNTGTRAHVTVRTPNGRVTFDGDAEIDGVPGTGSPINVDFLDVLGPTTGHVFPTGARVDYVDGVRVTCIDSANPVVLLHSDELGESGHEPPETLDADHPMLERLERVRREASLRMGLGDARGRVLPKVALLSPPSDGGSICSRYFVPEHCHAAHALTGAIAIAVATVYRGTVAEDIAVHEDGSRRLVKIEHPSGHIDVALTLEGDVGDDRRVVRAGVVRTARVIMDGKVFVHTSLSPSG